MRYKRVDVKHFKTCAHRTYSVDAISHNIFSTKKRTDKDFPQKNWTDTYRVTLSCLVRTIVESGCRTAATCLIIIKKENLC